MSASSAHPRGGTLVLEVLDDLRRGIIDGELSVGDKLPSEAELCQKHGVSRTVIREAISALRADGLVMAKRGAGVFVIPRAAAAPKPFSGINHAKISSVIEMIELRTALESEAAALAAIRRSPAQEEEIIERHRDVLRCIDAQELAANADFALHKAIADATSNPRFTEVMLLIGPDAIPRTSLPTPPDAEYLQQIHQEHERIVHAISNRDSEGAYAAMRSHLTGSQKRYRTLLLGAQGN